MYASSTRRHSATDATDVKQPDSPASQRTVIPHCSYWISLRSQVQLRRIKGNRCRKQDATPQHHVGSTSGRDHRSLGQEEVDRGEWDRFHHMSVLINVGPCPLIVLAAWV